MLTYFLLKKKKAALITKTQEEEDGEVFVINEIIHNYQLTNSLCDLNKFPRHSMIPEVGNKIKLPKENILIEEENLEDNTAEIVKQLHQLNQVNINSLPPIPQANNQISNVANQVDQFNQMHQGNFQIGGPLVSDSLDNSPILPQSGQKKSPLVPGKNMQGFFSFLFIFIFYYLVPVEKNFLLLFLNFIFDINDKC